MTNPLTEKMADLDVTPETWDQIAMIANANNITMGHATERLAYQYLLQKADAATLAATSSKLAEDDEEQSLLAKVWVAEENFETLQYTTSREIASLEKQVKKLKRRLAKKGKAIYVPGPGGPAGPTGVSPRPEKTREQLLAELDAVEQADYDELLRHHNELKLAYDHY